MMRHKKCYKQNNNYNSIWNPTYSQQAQSGRPQPLASGIDSVYCVKLRQWVIKKSINKVLKKFPIMGKVLVAEDLFSPVW